MPGGPAEQAGLEPGDVILALDGKAVEGSSELIVAIRSKRPGDSVTLTVRRDGTEQEIQVTLGARRRVRERGVFDIGPGEFIGLAIVALIVLGPEKLPRYAADAGQMLRQVRRMASDARTEVTRELGPEMTDLDLSDLTPRGLLRKHLLDPADIDDLDDVGRTPAARNRPGAQRPSRHRHPAAPPPYDADAT